MPIPLSVTQDEVNEALKPLYDLLGTSSRNILAHPGITIGDGEITFFVPVKHDEDPSGRAETLQVPGHPQGTPEEHHNSEALYLVRVEVTR